MISRLLVPKSSTVLVIAILALGVVHAHASADAGSGIYRILVADGGGASGTFAVSTGPEHPAGPDLSILYPGDAEAPGPGSYFTVRSYTTGTDYVQSGDAPASGNLVVPLDQYAGVQPIGQTGYKTTYDLPAPPAAPESLRIAQDVNVNGTTYADSAVEVSVTVTNQDVVPISIGLRYLLDLQVAGEDGPAVAPAQPGDAPLLEETSFADPLFDAVRLQDNDAESPQLSVLVPTVAGYPGISPATTQPDLVQYAFWSDAKSAAFDYDTQARDIASASGLDDSAVLIYFGANENDAAVIAPGESMTVSVSLFATPPVTGPEDCSNNTDDDGDRLTDSEDDDCQVGLPTGTPAAPPSAGPSATPARLPPTGRSGSEGDVGLGLIVAVGLSTAIVGISILVKRRTSAR